MVPKNRFDEVGSQMDSLLTAYISNLATFEETKARLVNLWRQLTVDWPRTPASDVQSMPSGQIRAEQFYHFTSGRSPDEMKRAHDVLQAALLEAAGKISEGTA